MPYTRRQQEKTGFEKNLFNCVTRSDLSEVPLIKCLSSKWTLTYIQLHFEPQHLTNICTILCTVYLRILLFNRLQFKIMFVKMGYM